MHDTLRAELKQQAVTLSLAANDAALFERYARWLRSVLVSRGMCTEHLAPVYIDGDAGRLEQARDALLAVVREAAGASAMRDDDQRYMCRISSMRWPPAITATSRSLRDVSHAPWARRSSAAPSR